MSKGKIELPESMRRQQTLERRLWRALGLRDGRGFGEVERRAIESVLLAGRAVFDEALLRTRYLGLAPQVGGSAEPPSYAEMRKEA